MNNYSTEQLQKIVDDAPDGAEYFREGTYRGNKIRIWSGIDSASLDGAIKLSDIRAELLTRPKFNVGDRVVVRGIQDFAITDFDYKALHKIESFATLNGVRSVCLDSFPFQCYAPITIIARATAEEEAAGHRIDEPSAVEAIVEFITNPGNAQADTITAQLDPAKCRVVDPTVYDAPQPMTTGELKVPAGLKHDQTKPRYSLIPAGSLSAVVGVLEYGATKYAPNNWRHVDNARERYYNASMRHVQAWWSGEQNDPETGLSHLAHAVCSLMFLMALEGEQGE